LFFKVAKNIERHFNIFTEQKKTFFLKGVKGGDSILKGWLFLTLFYDFLSTFYYLLFVIVIILVSGKKRGIHNFLSGII